MTTVKSVPKDAQVMAAILKDMGVTDYEPRVINQMMEFSYRKYVVVLGPVLLIGPTRSDA